MPGARALFLAATLVALAGAACGAPPAPAATPSPTLAAMPAATPTSVDTVTAPPSGVPIPGCGTGEAGFRTAAAVFDRKLRFGGTAIELVTAGMALRDGSWWADDAIPGFTTLSPVTAAIVGKAGAAITLSAAPGMRLTGIQADVYRWAALDFTNGLANPSEAARSTRALLDGIGAASITAPAQPGDYALAFGVHWLTECLSGDGVAYARVVVR